MAQCLPPASPTTFRTASEWGFPMRPSGAGDDGAAALGVCGDGAPALGVCGAPALGVCGADALDPTASPRTRPPSPLLGYSGAGARPLGAFSEPGAAIGLLTGQRNSSPGGEFHTQLEGYFMNRRFQEFGEPSGSRSAGYRSEGSRGPRRAHGGHGGQFGSLEERKRVFFLSLKNI